MKRVLPAGTITTRPPAFGVTRLRPLPAFGALLGFLLVFGWVQSLYLGSEGAFHNLGGPVPRADTPPRCVALAYTPRLYRWLPDTVPLTPEVQFRSRYGTWYRAYGPQGYQESWRLAGRDSIDISGHHKPVARIPARGAHRVGRGGWYGYQNAWELLNVHGWRVDATEISCPAAR